MTGSTFTGNTAADGGAIANGYSGTGTLTVSGSTFSGNTATADGGAIASGEQAGSTATLVVTGSTFSGNTATNDDGGRHRQRRLPGHRDADCHQLHVFEQRSELSTAAPSTPGTTPGTALSAWPAPRFPPTQADWGGAIDSGDTAGTGTLSVDGSTFTGNSVSSDGGAIDNGDGGGTGTLTVSGSTLSGQLPPERRRRPSTAATTAATAQLRSLTPPFRRTAPAPTTAGPSTTATTAARRHLTVTASTFSDNAATTTAGRSTTGTAGAPAPST